MADSKSDITKREAATAQLDTAIKLFFENRDLVSAYTLCAAADGILEGIYKNERATIMTRQYKKHGDAKMLRFSWSEELEIRLKPEYKREGYRLINATQNFFKHADKDHDSVHDFRGWEETGVRIFQAITNYHLVFGEVSPAMNVFFVLYVTLNPELLPEENPLFRTIVGNPLCEKLVERFTQDEIAAIGYCNLENACPELFPPTDIISHS